MDAKQIEEHMARMLEEARRYHKTGINAEFWRGTVTTLENLLWVIRHNRWVAEVNIAEGEHTDE